MLKLRENNDKDKDLTIKANKTNDLEIDCKTNQEKTEFTNSLGTNLKPNIQPRSSRVKYVRELLERGEKHTHWPSLRIF